MFGESATALGPPPPVPAPLPPPVPVFARFEATPAAEGDAEGLERLEAEAGGAFSPGGVGCFFVLFFERVEVEG